MSQSDVTTTVSRSDEASFSHASSARRTLRTCEPWAAALAILIVFVAAHWSIVRGLLRDWRIDDNYSVGQLVPFAALYMLWTDRSRLRRLSLSPGGWGIGLLLLGQAGRAFGVVYLYESAERYSLVITLAGLVLFVAGRAVFREVGWVLLFLFLMVPLPGVVHDHVSGGLQKLATDGAVFTLELLGIVVTQEGNTMVLNHNVPVAVAEACSGLRMLTAFVVVASVLAYVVHRPRWQKAVVVASSLPVALLCNLVRLVVTAILFLLVSSRIAERFFHDFAGLTMMPLAVFLLVGELWLLARLVIEDPRDKHKTPV